MQRQETPADTIARLTKELEAEKLKAAEYKAKHAAVIRDRDAKVLENAQLTQSLRESQDHVVRLTQQFNQGQSQQIASLQAENTELRRLFEAEQANNRSLQQKLEESRAQTLAERAIAQRERDLHAQTLKNNFAVRELREEMTALIQQLNPNYKSAGNEAVHGDSDTDNEEQYAADVQGELFNELKGASVGGLEKLKLTSSPINGMSPQATPPSIPRSIANGDVSPMGQRPTFVDLKSSGANVLAALATAHPNGANGESRETVSSPFHLDLSASGEVAVDKSSPRWVENPARVHRLVGGISNPASPVLSELDSLLQTVGSASSVRMGRRNSDG